ncbi:MAG: transposase [Caldicoprobacterales bacterium]|jgi:transposase|nr:transposase [Clostridiales bacterium]
MEKQRRKYTPEFKEEIVKLITEQGKTATEVSRDIEVHAGGWG